MSTPTRIALTIAGSDSGGGAGIQADLKTFSDHNVHGTSVITAVTAQNSQGVRAVHVVPPEVIRQQLEAVFDDFDITAIKIGMLADVATVQTVADFLQQHPPDCPIILDPVMVATSGDSLLQTEAIQVLQKVLLPLATLITPNIPEAEALADLSINSLDDMPVAARKLHKLYPNTAILVKGGHLNEENRVDSIYVSDYLYKANKKKHWIEGEYLESDAPTHGTGCIYSASIAAYMAHGVDVKRATYLARKYLMFGLQHRPGDIGHGAQTILHAIDPEFAKIRTRIHIS